MEIKTLASGSSGNCYRVSDGETPLLVECGIRFPLIRKGLNFKTSEIAGCLVSHEHGDHSKAAKDLMKIGIDCYMTKGTAEAIGAQGHHRVQTIQPLGQFQIGSWVGLSFPTEHDATEPVGFLLQSSATKEKLLFITDSFYCRYTFKGVTHLMLECNYAYDILAENIQAGIVSRAQQKRILRSHFSLDHVKNFLQANDLSRLQEIHLLHLSDDNSDEARFEREIEALTGIPTYVA